MTSSEKKQKNTANVFAIICEFLRIPSRISTPGVRPPVLKGSANVAQLHHLVSDCSLVKMPHLSSGSGPWLLAELQYHHAWTPLIWTLTLNRGLDFLAHIWQAWPAFSSWACLGMAVVGLILVIVTGPDPDLLTSQLGLGHPLSLQFCLVL